MGGDVILLYYSDLDVVPDPFAGNPDLYGIMCLVVRPLNVRGSDRTMETFIKSHRSLWLSWKRHRRDPQDYMYVWEHSVRSPVPRGRVRGVILSEYTDSDLGMLLYRLAIQWDRFNFVRSNFVHLFRRYPIL